MQINQGHHEKRSNFLKQLGPENVFNIDKKKTTKNARKRRKKRLQKKKLQKEKMAEDFKSEKRKEKPISSSSEVEFPMEMFSDKEVDWLAERTPLPTAELLNDPEISDFILELSKNKENAYYVAIKFKD